MIQSLTVGADAPTRAELQDRLDAVYALFPRLEARRKSLAGYTSGGEQQMVAIGRALMARPRLVLLDEPSMGLAPTIADLIFERIASLHREDRLTIVLVEQRVAEALQSCDHGYVLETGQVELDGPHDRLLADDRVRRAY